MKENEGLDGFRRHAIFQKRPRKRPDRPEAVLIAIGILTSYDSNSLK